MHETTEGDQYSELTGSDAFQNGVPAIPCHIFVAKSKTYTDLDVSQIISTFGGWVSGGHLPGPL